MLLYAQTSDKLSKRYVIIGQYLALAILVIISLIGAAGLNIVPQKYVGFLGIIPIILGIKEWVSYTYVKHTNGKQKKVNKVIADENEPQLLEDNHKKANQTLSNVKSVISKVIRPEILSVVTVAIANGADNIGVYIPLFTGYSSGQLFLTFFIFACMMALWCFLGDRITSFPKVKNDIQRCKHIAIPIIFIGLGIYIILKSSI